MGYMGTLLPAWFFCKSKAMLKLSLSLKKIEDKKIAPTFPHLNSQEDLIWERFPCPMWFTHCNSIFVWKVQKTDF